METISAIIADNQKMFTTGLKSVLKNDTSPKINLQSIVSDAATLRNALSLESFDVLFLELNLPDEDGLEILPEIRKDYKDLKICVISNYEQTKFVKKAFQNGADAYFSKNNGFEDFLQGVKEVMEGNTFLGKRLRITPANSFGGIKLERKPSTYEDRFLIKQKLTSREHEVLELITQAKNNKEIAKELYISDQTVGVHRKNIMRKLGVRNTINLIKFAMEHQLV
jgi:two-component system NarL family response regulator